MAYLSIEYIKFFSYVLAGVAAARAWFHKEIVAGKIFLKHFKLYVDNKAKRVETAVETEVKKIESKI